jgi:hypothetical protein
MSRFLERRLKTTMTMMVMMMTKTTATISVCVDMQQYGILATWGGGGNKSYLLLTFKQRGWFSNFCTLFMKKMSINFNRKR